jgi:nitroreductase
MPDGTDVLEIIRTTRAMRRLKPDPVPDAMIRTILDSAICAPNGGNTQTWRFLVVKDPEIKKAVQVHYKRALDEVVGPRYASAAPPPGATKDGYHRQHTAVEYLTEHFHEAPVWIVACIDHGDAPPNRASGASIYPAVQNMLLTARALGLGATLTTRHLLVREGVGSGARPAARRAFVCDPADRLSYGEVRSGRPRRPRPVRLSRHVGRKLGRGTGLRGLQSSQELTGTNMVRASTSSA